MEENTRPSKTETAPAAAYADSKLAEYANERFTELMKERGIDTEGGAQNGAGVYETDECVYITGGHDSHAGCFEPVGSPPYYLGLNRRFMEKFAEDTNG